MFITTGGVMQDRSEALHSVSERCGDGVLTRVVLTTTAAA